MAGPEREVPRALGLGIVAWAAWSGAGEAMASGGEIHPASPLPAALRRRITPIGRKALEAAWIVLAGRPGLEPRIVLSSRHGEYVRAVGLLSSLAESGEVSPAEFSLAVHHGLAGLLSIVTGNHAGHLAVAAGIDSFGAALWEAAACVNHGEGTVLLLHFDEALPDSYAPVGGGPEEELALALLLSAGDGVQLDWQPAEVAGSQSAAAALLRLLGGDTDRVVATGERMIWSFRRAA
jgi:hypothetical protein